ncbi:dipeptidase [Pilimelia terevasa]|uniref:Dipeptidase n=1 Tax=Pilimelia terevasa TaxID=53372 RepID=A0A8J3FKP7_9ACTN|nr:dipeptidase [Pilimelia terevasa]GGK29479.1 dipeptidase [Pilimelia terevasa]
MTLERIRALLAAAPVLDGHNDLAWEMRVRVGYDTGRIDLRRDQRATGLHTDLPRLAAGGVGAQVWSVYVPAELPPGRHVAATLEQVDFVRRWVAANPDRLALATTADGVEAARAAGRVAALLGAEGGHSIGNSLATLRMLAELGVRYLTLTHNRNVPWADSATDVPATGGLTAFGREVVGELNRLGLLVDLSHTAVGTMHAALDASRAPAFFSHSNARSRCGHPRNVPDDVLVRVRDSGGIVMATFVPWFLTEECRDWAREALPAADRAAAGHTEGTAAHRAARDAWLAAHPMPPVGLADVADHLDHLREVAGVGAVGLGGDFDGTPVTVAGLPDVAAYPALLATLADRGWSDAELAALTWHNALRVLRESESVAAALQRERGPSLATFEECDRPARPDPSGRGGSARRLRSR